MLQINTDNTVIIDKVYHTTIDGDTWDILSLKYYGTEMRMGDIIKANPKYIGETSFTSGISLFIPDVQSVSSVNKISEYDSLPPWMR